MAKKIKDLAVKVGEYTDKNGEKKGRWQNIGAMMAGDDGNTFLLLERWVNLAGVPDLSGKGSNSCLVSCFDIKEGGYADRQVNADMPTSQASQGAKAVANSDDDLNDDIPF